MMKNEISKAALLNLLIDENQGAIFSAEDLNSPIKLIYNKLENIGLPGVNTLSDLISRVDSKSEITEILGVDEFFSNITKTFECEKSSRIYLPIKMTDETCVYSFRAIRNEKNGGIYCYLQLIDSETLDIERLYADSYKDSLTYLFNKNALDFHLGKNVGYHFIGFFDLDNFKYVNDTYSHHAGNQLLTEIGKKLITVSDNNVIYYRYAGDEFVFMTIDLSFQETIALANKIQKAINEIDYEGFHPTLSIGISEFNAESNYTVQDAVKLADFAMYKSKYNGKNRISYISAQEGNDLFKVEKLDEILDKYKKIRNNGVSR